MDLIETQLDNPLEHWYYSHKFWAITELMNRNNVRFDNLVDVGAGSAVFSKAIKKSHPKTQVFAIDTGYSDEQLMNNKDGITYLRNPGVIVGDCYLMTDVIEHIQNDQEFLKSYADLALSGSYFVITVPAFMSLWSNHDVYLKHFRRYTKNEVLGIAESSGLEVLEARYLYGALFPLAWIKRRLIRKSAEVSDLRQDPFVIQGILKFILKFDKLISKRSPLGISAIAICRKK